MTSAIRGARARSVSAAALAIILASAWISPGHAAAQLSLGSLIVTMTSPANGATVGNTITVSASVSIVGSLTVSSVQFQLDGANLGARDTSAPYSTSWNTRTASNGSHTLRAVARDLLGVQYVSNPVAVTVFNDTTPPTVAITTPAPGAILSGTRPVTASASDNVGVAGVQFRLDGANLGAEDTTPPYSVSWNTTTAASGAHTLTAVARDAAGNRRTSAGINVTVDNAPPTVALTAPAPGAILTGTATVSAAASDNVGVTAVQFFVDGTALGAEDTTAPFAVDWDTRAASSGAHTLTAAARDASGHRTTSAPVDVTVDNVAPTVVITAPAAESTVGGTTIISADASDNVEVAGVQFFVDGATLGSEDSAPPYSIEWDTTAASEGSHSVTAAARDRAGNTATSAAVIVTVANQTAVNRLEDTSAAIAYAGSWAQGNRDRSWSGGTAAVATAAAATATVTFTGTGVSWISFRGPQMGIADVFVDGTMVATVDAYAAAEETGAVLHAVSGLSSGTHTMSIASTGRKNAASTDVLIVVDAFDVTGSGVPGGGSDTTAPTVSVTAPAAGATVSGTVMVSASAADDSRVGSVSFFANGVQIGPEVVAEPYAVGWDTTTVANGPYTLTAVARDAAGNSATSAEVAVTVSNDVTPRTRIEETSAAITYTGGWLQGNTDRPWSGGSAALATAASARATLRFVGTEVSWIGFRGPQAGIARVFLDGALVATVDAYAPAEALQAVLFAAGGLADAEHTLAIEVTGDRNASASDSFVVVDAFDAPSAGGGGGGGTFAAGDVFVSLEPGPVQWRRADGLLAATLEAGIPGTAEGMAFDREGNLYVTRWCIDPTCSTTGNTVERFDTRGASLGAFGSGYDCNPHAIVFDAAGTAYVGQAGCAGAILKLVNGQPPVAFAAAEENQGSFWIDLAPDGCTIYYTSQGPNVKRFDACAGVQLADFNAAPLPGGVTQDLRVLSDGGVLVSSGDVIVRLDASGVLVRTYEVPGESRPWAGLDLAGDGTFWAGNYQSSNVYRFDLATGAVLASFNSGTPSQTVVGIRIKR